MASKLTCMKVEREILKKAQTILPEYTAGEIFKVGYTALNSLNKANEIIYGKNNVKKARGMK